MLSVYLSLVDKQCHIYMIFGFLYEYVEYLSRLSLVLQTYAVFANYFHDVSFVILFYVLCA